MSELVLDGLDDTILGDLRVRAARHGRTVPEEAKAILAEALAPKRTDSWAAVDAIYDRLTASGKTFTDSTELLREDRDR